MAELRLGPAFLTFSFVLIGCVNGLETFDGHSFHQDLGFVSPSEFEQAGGCFDQLNLAGVNQYVFRSRAMEGEAAPASITETLLLGTQSCPEAPVM